THPSKGVPGENDTGATGGEFTVDHPVLNCEHEDPGAPFKKENTSQFTFGGGVAISGDIGIDLSARTGWSKNGIIHLNASPTPAPGVRLCGKNAPPGRSPAKLQFIPAA